MITEKIINNNNHSPCSDTFKDFQNRERSIEIRVSRAKRKPISFQNHLFHCSKSVIQASQLLKRKHVYYVAFEFTQRLMLCGQEAFVPTDVKVTQMTGEDFINRGKKKQIALTQIVRFQEERNEREIQKRERESRYLHGVKVTAVKDDKTGEENLTGVESFPYFPHLRQQKGCQEDVWKQYKALLLNCQFC